MSVNVFLCHIAGKKKKEKMTSLSIKIHFSFLVPCCAMKISNSEAMNEILDVHKNTMYLYNLAYLHCKNTKYEIVKNCKTFAKS